jgi:carboxymethylenebutenolidase
MCYDTEAAPPVFGTADRTAETASTTLDSADGTTFAAFAAKPEQQPGGVGVVVLPDQRGLCRFYEQLATGLAGHGHAAVAIDYFGRTAGTGYRARPADFPGMPLLMTLTRDGMQADMAAAAEHLRSPAGGACRSVVALGFCLGGRAAFFAATSRLRFAGAIGFYGHPGIAGPYGPGPTQHAAGLDRPILGLFGGADTGIPAAARTEFADALSAAGVEHEIVTYPDAPHGFFDTGQDRFASESADAWRRVLGFLARR